MRKLLAALAAGVTALSGAAFADDVPHLGHVATPAEIAPWDIDVSPDGAGLPPGSGTARRGEAIYAAKCRACHGADGTGTPADRLAGGKGTIGAGASTRPIKTIGSFWPYATSVLAYIRRAMPYDDAKSLSNDELYAVTAYLLHLNGLVGLDDALDARSLPKIRMPNRDGFVRFKRGD
jgi:cytochrome c